MHHFDPDRIPRPPRDYAVEKLLEREKRDSALFRDILICATILAGAVILMVPFIVVYWSRGTF